jgi:N-acetylmuramoyl-L-alanine amidase-like protein
MSEYPGAIDMFVSEDRVFINQNTHQYLVIHKTAGFETVQQLGAYFATTTEETSSHFGVGLDGSIAQFVLLKDGAAANCCGANVGNYGGGNINLRTVSIEHIDPTTDNSTIPPQEQLAASFDLAKWICKKYGLTSKQVIGHNQIDPINRARCPGNYPIVLLRKYIDMPSDTTINESIVQIWNDCQWVLGNLHGIPPRDTVIFNAWRSELIAGRFRGIPLMNQEPGVDFDGAVITRQQFTMGMAWEYSDGTVIWSDLT